MDHEVAVKQGLTEKYLLNELDPAIKEEFEEHFFDCQECALDVRSAFAFVEHSKTILSDSDALQDKQVVAPVRPTVSWWAVWLRPAFVAPVLALLLGVVAYQNLVEYPRLLKPQVLPMMALAIDTFSATDQNISVSRGQGFLLMVRISPNSEYFQYSAILRDPANRQEEPVAISAVNGQDQWPVQFPAITRQPGTYTLTVYGVSVNGESKEIGRKSFELQVQQ